MIDHSPSQDADRRQSAAADRALACAAALGRDLHGSVECEHLASRHALRLRLLAKRSEAVGLPWLAEVARLTMSALADPRREPALVGQAVDVLTLAGHNAKRRVPARADLGSAVDALRDHLRYARAASDHD